MWQAVCECVAPRPNDEKKRTAENKWIGTEGEGRGDLIALKRICSCYEGIKRRINSREARIGIRMTKKGLGRGKR